MNEYERDKARRICFWLVLVNLILTVILVIAVLAFGWNPFWIVLLCPAAVEHLFFVTRGMLRGFYFPVLSMLVILAHAVLPMVGWILLNKKNYVGKKLIRISWILSIFFAFLTVALNVGSAYAGGQLDAGPYLGAYVLDILYIILLRKNVNTWNSF